MHKPVSVGGTRRQSVVTGTGLVLERQSIYLPRESWKALQRLCIAQGRSGSQIIESLIQIAALGGAHKDNNNERSSATRQSRA